MSLAAQDRIELTDKDLLYAATARCRCGAGLAHPLDHELAMKLRSWACSAVLKGEHETAPVHDRFDFALYKVREETSINNTGGHTTRPPGTVARTVGKATCPKCSHTWQSEPYSACGSGHHWFPGACPSCGCAIGGNGTYRSGEGAPIETRYPDVVLDDSADQSTR